MSRPTPESEHAGDGWSRRRFVGLAGACAVLAVALRWTILKLPLMLDDFAHLAMGTETGWIHRAPWDRFRFMSGVPEETMRLMRSGRVPWWTDPSLRLAPCRPLGSLEESIDYAMFKGSAVAAHADSLVWLACLMVAAGVLLRAALPFRTAVFALPLYALSRAHGLAVAWAANRPALLAVTFGFLAIERYVRFRTTSALAPRVHCLCFLVLSLLCAEYGLCIFAYLVAFELFEARDTLQARLKALVAPVLVALVYALVFRAGGCGARGTTLYIDPSAEPGRFFSGLIIRAFMLTDMLLMPFERPSSVNIIVTLLVAAALLGALFMPVAEATTRRARWLFIGGLLATLPLAAAAPDFRLIAFPALGVAAAIGAVMDAATRPGAWGHRIIGAPLLATHAFFAPIGMLSDLDALRIHEVLRQASLAAPIPKEPDVDVLLLSSRDVFSTHYPPLVRWFSGMPLLRAWWVLSCTGAGLEVRRTGIADLELRTLGLGLLDHPWAMTYLLPQHAPPKGTVVNAGRMRAEVLEVGPAGPTRVKFTLPESLDDPKLVMLFPKPGGWVRFTPPSIGGVVSLPPAPW